MWTSYEGLKDTLVPQLDQLKPGGASEVSTAVAPGRGMGLGSELKQAFSSELDKFRNPKQMLRDKLKEDPAPAQSPHVPLNATSVVGAGGSSPQSSSNWMQILENLKPKGVY
jgi:hypothetical protein